MNATTNTAGVDLDKPQHALAAITNRLALAYNLCCGLAPKQAVGELLEVTINMPEWEIVHSALQHAAPEAPACAHVWNDFGQLGGRNVSWCPRCDTLAWTGKEPAPAAQQAGADYSDPTLACSSCGLTIGESRTLGHIQLGILTTSAATTASASIGDDPKFEELLVEYAKAFNSPAGDLSPDALITFIDSRAPAPSRDASPLDDLKTYPSPHGTLIRLTDAKCRFATLAQQGASHAPNELIGAADAVVERWHSRDWKQPHTAEFIARLSAAVGAAKRNQGAAHASNAGEDTERLDVLRLANGYESGFFASDPKDNYAQFTLHYKSAAQAEAAYLLVTSIIDAAIATSAKEKK